MRRAAVVIALGVLTWQDPALTRQDPAPTVFRSGASAVVVDVAVRYRTRRPVTGLRAADFEVLDNGVPQRVDQVSYGKLPIDVTVALDVSASVTGALLDQLRQGVVTLTRGLGSGDRVRLLLFNARIARIVDFTRDAQAIDRALREAGAGGGTPLMDALSVGLTSAADIERRQLLMAFTDGGDSISTTTPEMLLAVAQRSRATVALVMPAEPGTPTVLRPAGAQIEYVPRIQRGPMHDVLTAVTRETGGSIIPTDRGSGLSSAFRTVLDEFRSAYVLYYTPRDVERGGYHTIEVKVKSSDLTVQARRGYFGS
jgi:VWFA-related protein